jgi:hypothetical protein
MGLMCIKLHYKVDPLLKFDNLKDVVDSCSRNVNFLNNKSRKTFAMFSITYSLSEDPNVCSLTNWKNIFSSLLSMKVAFKTII